MGNRGTHHGTVTGQAGANRRARTMLRLWQLFSAVIYVFALVALAFGLPVYSWASALALIFAGKTLLFRRHLAEIPMSLRELAILYSSSPFSICRIRSGLRRDFGFSCDGLSPDKSVSGGVGLLPDNGASKSSCVSPTGSGFCPTMVNPYGVMSCGHSWVVNLGILSAEETGISLALARRMRVRRNNQYGMTTLELSGAEMDVQIKLVSKLGKSARRTVVRSFLRQIRPWIEHFNRTDIHHSENRRVIEESPEGRKLKPFQSRSIESPQGALGYEIRMTRLKLGLSQVRLAAELGIQRSHLSDIERGMYYPHLRTRLKLQEALGIRLVADYEAEEVPHNRLRMLGKIPTARAYSVPQMAYRMSGRNPTKWRDANTRMDSLMSCENPTCQR